MFDLDVNGIDEFLRALDKLQGGLPELAAESGHDAATITIDAARPDVPIRSGAARRSLDVSDAPRGAFALGGSRDVPYYAWLEFGGSAGIDGSVQRSVVPKGRYLWPAYLDSFDQIELVMAKDLTELLKDVRLK